MESSMQAMGEAIRALQAQVVSLQTQLAATQTSSVVRSKPAKPDYFYGSTDATRVRQWCFSVEIYFAAANVIPSEQVLFAVTLLRGHALTWWQSLHESLRPNTWELFKSAMIAYHQPTSAVIASRDALARLTQRTSVRQYVQEFKELALNIPNFSDDERLDRFKRGLKNDVRLQVALANPSTFDDAVNVASQVDDILFAHRRPRQLEGFNHNLNSNRSSTATPMELGAMKDVNRRSNFFPPQVPSRTTRLTDEMRRELSATGACFYCREHGHVAAQCPKKRYQGNAQSRRQGRDLSSTYAISRDPNPQE
jgi:hypothetical protein